MIPHLLSHPETAVRLSVVIPFYNEGLNVARVLAELRETLKALPMPYEVLAVNDGSTDDTAEQLQELSLRWPELNPIMMPANGGQAAALWAGFKAAKGDIVATLDGDGQNDPSALAAMIAHLESSGADMVAGVRAQREDSWLRRRMSRVANHVRQFFLKDGVSDSGCALKVMRREVLAAFVPLRTLYSFMPALAVAAGCRVVEMAVPHRARTAGVSSYGLIAMLWRPAVDMLGIWWFSQRRFNVSGRVVKPASSSWQTLWIWMLPLMLFFMLGQRGLNEPDEGRYAEIAREMVTTGDWLVPHLNGIEHFQKPPVIYWSTALMFKIFGFNEWAARLPSALAAWGVVCLTFLLTRRLWGAARAHLTATMLMSMLGIFIMGRLLTPDMTMCFWIIAAITALVHERPWWFFACMGFGFLTKGPMALVVPLGALIGKNLAGGRMLRWPWTRGLLLTFSIGLSWFILLAAMKPELLDYFVRYELIERVASKAHGRAKPWWFFAPVLVIAMLPWSFGLPSLIKRTWQRCKTKTLTVRQGMLLGWVALPLLILSCSGSKLATYILPLLPAFAIALSVNWPDARRIWQISATAIALWSAIILSSGAGNDMLGRQASVRDLCAKLQTQLQKEPGEVFTCGTRAHGFEFYLQQCVGTTRQEADIVLPTARNNAPLVYENAAACAIALADKSAYGLMLRDCYVKHFASHGWHIFDQAGDYVVATHAAAPFHVSNRNASHDHETVSPLPLLATPFSIR